MQQVTIGLIGPIDAYHKSGSEFIGRKGTIVQGKYWSDGWWHGRIKFGNGTSTIFYQVRFLKGRVE